MASSGSPRSHDGRERRRVQFNTVGESKTRQSDKDKADVKKILERFVRSGEKIPVPGPGEFGDVSAVGGFFENTERILAGRQAYESFPRELKERYTPQEVFELVSTDEGANMLLDEFNALVKPPVDKAVDKGEKSVKTPDVAPAEPKTPV